MLEVIDQNKLKTKIIIVIFNLLLILVFCNFFYALFDTFSHAYDIPFFNFYFELDKIYKILIIVLCSTALSLISSFYAFHFSKNIILRLSKARPANSHEDEIVIDSIEGLCIGAGLPVPKIYVIDDSAPNAFSTGKDPEHAVVCVTSGLLSKLDSYELEAVLAHEIGHIKNHDILLSSASAVMVGIITLFADFFKIGSIFRKNRKFTLIGLIAFPFAVFYPLVAILMKLALSRNSEYLADAVSVELCKNPDALIRALTKLYKDQDPLESANNATANMYIVSPFKEANSSFFSRLFATHPTLEQRIDAIKNIH